MNTLPECFDTAPAGDAVAVTPLAAGSLESWLAGAGDGARTWVAASGFAARAGAGSRIMPVNIVRPPPLAATAVA